MARRRNYIGKQVGNYQVIDEHARGAYGRVYRGEHIILRDRIVAIKFLHAYLSSQQEHDQFFQEARLLEKLKHPHILLIYDVGVDKGYPYLVTEFAPNGSLRDRIKRQSQQPLTLQEAITILEQIGQALHYAHQQNIIHRDLKPENILFNAKGEALLADFGIATMLDVSNVRHGDIIGIRLYMAPEELKGKISKESDQYALGCIAYELFTGQQPFIAPDLPTLKNIKKRNPLPPTRYNPTLPTYIEQAILKAMAEERADRHTDVEVFITMLHTTTILPDTSQRTNEQRLDENSGKVVESTAHHEFFNVFLCYSPEDVEEVKKLAERLEDEEDLRVWFNEWEQIPGEHWQQTRERGMNQSRCCAIFIGGQTPDGWFQEEVEAARKRQTEDPSFRVIPVFLPNAKDIKVDTFLELRARVDFRTPDPAYAFHCLVCGVKGIPLGRWPPKMVATSETVSDVADELRKLKQLAQEMNLDPSLVVDMQRDILKGWRVEDRLRKLKRWVREGIVDASFLLEKQGDILEDH